jgi:arylformamidase
MRKPFEHPYIDISPAISSDLAVFPGDVSFKRDISMDFKKGHHLGLSSVLTTLHIGAHVDAPNHYNAKGCGIGERDLSYYYGDCQVVEVKIPRGQRIRFEDLKKIEIKAPRVLFKTGSFPDPHKWANDFNSLSKDLINILHKKDVILVGIDTPSIDLAEDKILESHNAVFENDMAVLEGVVLDAVKPGFYKLVALPLRIKDGDASPVRAILINEMESMA